MKKSIKIVLIIIVCVLLVIAGIAVTALMIRRTRMDSINDDFSGVFSDEKYSEPVSVDGVEVITQDVSCGYAVIQMFSSWCGGDITEQALYDKYGSVVTSTGASFCEEMNKQFPQYNTTMHKYLTNTGMIEAIYYSLKNGVPVPFEWAALYGNEWTLHYSLITGMDIPNNNVTIANPYGYYENIPLEDFLARTRFDAYENMPLFLKLGFAFGIFEENTVFIAEKKG